MNLTFIPIAPATHFLFHPELRAFPIDSYFFLRQNAFTARSKPATEGTKIQNLLSLYFKMLWDKKMEPGWPEIQENSVASSSHLSP